MRRARLVLGWTLLLCSACTGARPAAEATRAAQPSSGASASSTSEPPVVLDVVAGASPTGRPVADPAAAQAVSDGPYLDGMRLAVADVNGDGGVHGHPLRLRLHDDGGNPATASRVTGGILAARPVATLFVGPAPALAPLRYQAEQAGSPIVLLQGDLYTSRQTFRQVFQTTIPWQWQAKVIARYVVRDRRARDVVFGGEGPEAKTALDAFAQAMAYWGGRLSPSSFTYRAGEDISARLSRAARADWFVPFGSPFQSSVLVNEVEEAAGIDRVANPSQRPGVTGSTGLLTAEPGLAKPEPGTSACSTYTWAGWAEPLRRVRAFDGRFRAMFGHAPVGPEQEGYDAVRVLAMGLDADGGLGGARLTSALEAITNAQFSGFPIRLGPDDHEFAPRDELGLFAVAAPTEELDPWEQTGSEPWRPIMRTFTIDGRRDTILDEDRRLFFPAWRKDRPGPFYWESRYGITTRPGADPLH